MPTGGGERERRPHVVELHLAPVSGRQKSITASATAAGSSRWGTCPESANTWRRAPGISFVHVWPQGTRGASRSWAPQQTSVGAVIRASRRKEERVVEVRVPAHARQGGALAVL